MPEIEYDFFSFLNELQKTKRYWEYDEAFSESVSEHTYKLIVMVDKFFDVLKLDLDYRKCIKMAMYHDLGEVGMNSDIDAYKASKDKNLKASKKETESKKVLKISQRYDSEEIYEIFREYEEKLTQEAKFVNAVDKLETRIHCLGVEADLKYADFFVTHIDDAIRNFPKLMPFYRVLKLKMKENFEERGRERKEEYDLVFN